MPISRRRGVLIAACLLLAGCAAAQGRFTNTPTQELLTLLQTGRPVLDCREPCLGEWQRVQPQAAQLHAAARWSDLAVLVMRTGYQDDLSLYYLGRASEGLGYGRAAQSYYRQSTQLSGTSISCQNLSRLCGGIVLPTAALQRIAAIDQAFAPLPPRRPARVGPRAPGALPAGAPPAEAPVAEPAAVTLPEAPAEIIPPPIPPAPAPMPPAPQAPAVAPVPVAPPAAAPSGVYDYIEPPPARR